MKIESFDGSDGFTNLNVLLFGGPGEGKSTGALSAPGPILYLSTEQTNALRFGADHHDVDDLDVVTLEKGKIGETIEEFALHAENETDHYASIVVDTVGDLRSAVLEELGGTVARPTLQSHGDANYVVSSLVRRLIALPDTNVVFVCHEDIQTDEFGERLHVPHVGGKEVPRVLGQLADVIGFCKLVSDDEGEKVRTVAKFVDNGAYAKDRTAKLGTHADVNISDWLSMVKE